MPGTIADRETAEKELRLKNQKIIDYLPPELRLMGEPIRIFSVFPAGPVPMPMFHRSLGSYGQFVIHCREEGEEYSAPTEIPYLPSEMIHQDMFKMVPRFDSGAKLANDVIGVGPYHSPAEDLTKWGVFIAAGKEPTAKEVAEAHRKLNRTWDFHISEADNFWNQGPAEYKNVGELHRLAAKMRGQTDKPWAREVQQMKSCPVCGNQIVPGAALCTHCKAVFNESVVIANKVPGYEHLWGKEAKGKNAEKS